MRRPTTASCLALVSLAAAGALASCSDDTPTTSATTTASPTTPPPSTTPGQTPATSAAGGSGRLQVVQDQYGSCLTKLKATALVDVGDGRSVTSTIKNGAVTLRWSISGTKAVPADEGTADFLGAAGC